MIVKDLFQKFWDKKILILKIIDYNCIIKLISRSSISEFFQFLCFANVLSSASIYVRYNDLKNLIYTLNKSVTTYEKNIMYNDL